MYLQKWVQICNTHENHNCITKWVQICNTHEITCITKSGRIFNTHVIFMCITNLAGSVIHMKLHVLQHLLQFLAAPDRPTDALRLRGTGKCWSLWDSWH